MSLKRLLFIAASLVLTCVIAICLLIASVFYFRSQEAQVGRNFFSSSKGIGIANPAPDKDGHWTMPVEYKLETPIVDRFIVWKAQVVQGRIELRAYTVKSNILLRLAHMADDYYGASIPYEAMPNGEYQVVFMNPDGTISDLSNVVANDSNDFGGERRWR